MAPTLSRLRMGYLPFNFYDRVAHFVLSGLCSTAKYDIYDCSFLDSAYHFRFAYTFKDSLLYSDLLDSSFLFISKNYATSPPTEYIWGKDIDIKTTIGMFRHFNILELTWGYIPNPNYNEDSTRSDLRVTFQLILDGGRQFPAITGEALYNFNKHSDKKWRITRWEDLSSF